MTEVFVWVFGLFLFISIGFNIFQWKVCQAFANEIAELQYKLRYSQKQTEAYALRENAYLALQQNRPTKTGFTIDAKTRDLLKLALNNSNSNESLAAALQVCKRIKLK